MKKILVIGSANADLLINTERMPKLGETVTGWGFTTNAGGKGLNQAVAVAKLGGDVGFLGVLGQDANGDMLLDVLNKNNIIYKGIRVDGVPTGSALVTLVNGDNFIILNEGTNGMVTPELIEEKTDVIAAADYIVLQLEIPVESVVRIAEIAQNLGKTVILNPAPYKELPEKLYSLIDILIPNEHEAEQVTGISVDSDESVEKAIKLLNQKGIKTALITLGGRGCAYNDGDKIVFAPSIKTNVVDTTSAGDSFIGGLCCRLASGDSLAEAVKYATKVASITVSRSGAAASIPFKHEVEEN